MGGLPGREQPLPRPMIPHRLNYRVILAKKAASPRNAASHAVNLCDMHAKSAEDVSTAEILSYIKPTFPGYTG
jgi:hypothetical protein